MQTGARPRARSQPDRDRIPGRAPKRRNRNIASVVAILVDQADFAGADLLIYARAVLLHASGHRVTRTSVPSNREKKYKYDQSEQPSSTDGRRFHDLGPHERAQRAIVLLRTFPELATNSSPSGAVGSGSRWPGLPRSNFKTVACRRVRQAWRSSVVVVAH